MSKTSWESKHTHSLAGKTVVITGATGGLGQPLCRQVLALGGRLVLLTRSREKTEKLMADLLEAYPKAGITPLYADLTDMEAVREACARLKTMPVDILIHNAGAYAIPRKTCSTGLDNVFQTNFMTPYYITRQLLPLLEERRGKVVAVGSIAHNYSKTDPKDIDFSTRTSSGKVYGNSKRYLMFGLWELMQEHPAVRMAVGHPGVTFTNITAHYPKWLFAIIKWPMKVIFIPPAKAARGVVQAVFEDIPYLHWAGPWLFHVWGNPSVSPVNTADAAERQRIYATAQRLYAEIEASGTAKIR